MQRTPAGALLGSELGLRRPVPRVHGAVVVTILNRVLAAALQDGALDFLRGRTVCVRVSDMRQAFCITLEGSGLTARRSAAMAELCLTGNLHAFLQLAARCEDADTLFFRVPAEYRG